MIVRPKERITKMARYQVLTDWRWFDRGFAVVDVLTVNPRDPDRRPEWVLQTNDKKCAEEFAAELNAE
jgi:hypothetical protein